MARNADHLQDAGVSGAQRALEHRGRLATMTGVSNERSMPWKTLPLLTIRLSKTISPGSRVSITGGRKGRMLGKAGGQRYLTDRATNSSLRTSMSTLARLLRQTLGTVGNPPGMVGNRDNPVHSSGPNFRAITGRFLRTAYTSLDSNKWSESPSSQLVDRMCMYVAVVFPK